MIWKRKRVSESPERIRKSVFGELSGDTASWSLVMGDYVSREVISKRFTLVVGSHKKQRRHRKKDRTLKNSFFCHELHQ